MTGSKFVYHRPRCVFAILIFAPSDRDSRRSESARPPNDFRPGPCAFWAVLTKRLGQVRPVPLWTLQVVRLTVVRSTLGITKHLIYCSSAGRWRGWLAYRLRLGSHSQIKPSRFEPVVARRNSRCFAHNESGAQLIQRNWLPFKTGPHSQTY